MSRHKSLSSDVAPTLLRHAATKPTESSAEWIVDDEAADGKNMAKMRLIIFFNLFTTISRANF